MMLRALSNSCWGPLENCRYHGPMFLIKLQYHIPEMHLKMIKTLNPSSCWDSVAAVLSKLYLQGAAVPFSETWRELRVNPSIPKAIFSHELGLSLLFGKCGSFFFGTGCECMCATTTHIQHAGDVEWCAAPLDPRWKACLYWLTRDVFLRL